MPCDGRDELPTEQKLFSAARVLEKIDITLVFNSASTLRDGDLTLRTGCLTTDRLWQ